MRVVKWMLDDVNDYEFHGVRTVTVEAGREARRQLLAMCRLEAGALRDVEIKVLGWLRHQSRSPRKVALDLNRDFPWCAERKSRSETD